MPRFSKTSLRRREGVHPNLCRLFDRIVLKFDCIVLSYGGVRKLELQQWLVDNGKSKTLNSKHLVQPSGFGHALDVAPYWREVPHVRWPSQQEGVEAMVEVWKVWSAFGGYVRGIAESLEISVRHGADWDSDWEFGDQHFTDSPHWELI